MFGHLVHMHFLAGRAQEKAAEFRNLEVIRFEAENSTEFTELCYTIILLFPSSPSPLTKNDFAVQQVWSQSSKYCKPLLAPKNGLGPLHAIPEQLKITSKLPTEV